MKAILGSMTFGEQVDQDNAQAMLQLFLTARNNEIDTAHAYVDGKTETMLGELIGDEQRALVHIASKLHPWNDNGLKPEQVRKQLDESLQRLQTDSVDLLYLHAPDLDTPIAHTLEACFELYQQGKFKSFGLSNYAAWQVAEIAETCRRNGWMEPTVYQGMYNALTRDVERELFPCLRNYGIRFYAYNPLAGGLLTGKYQSLDDLPKDGRFGMHEAYQQRYWKKDYFAMLQKFDSACKQSGIKPTEAAISWLINHSLLDAECGDGVIVGASKLSQLRENLTAFEQAPLKQSIIEVLDQGWEVTRPNCFRYFRP